MRLSDAVFKLIDRSSFLQEALYNDLINKSSLARLIKPDVDYMTGKKNSLLAIGKAISRSPDFEISALEKLEYQVRSAISDIIIRSDLVDITYANSETLLQAQSGILREVSEDSRLFLSLMRGIYETTIVFSASLYSSIEERFTEEKKLSERQNLSAISVLLDATNVDTRGLYYHLFKKLSWNGINVIEVLSTSNELTLILEKTDMEEAFAQFMKLKNG